MDGETIRVNLAHMPTSPFPIRKPGEPLNKGKGEIDQLVTNAEGVTGPGAQKA